MSTTPQHAPTLPGWDEPALMSEDAEGPTEEALQEWAEHYVSPQSAEAFAEHLWRGEEDGYPPTPAP